MAIARKAKKKVTKKKVVRKAAKKRVVRRRASSFEFDEAREFAALIKPLGDTWRGRGVKYDPSKYEGIADLTHLGKIEFYPSSNDPAVIVLMTGPVRIKASPKDAARALEEISDIIANLS